MHVVTDPAHLNTNLACRGAPLGRLGLSTLQCNSKQQTLQASRAETLPTCHDPEGKLLLFNYKQGKVTI